MKKLLVVSIAETFGPDKYSIVSYDQTCNSFLDFSNMSHDSLWEPHERKARWDLFGMTSCNVMYSGGKSMPTNPIKFMEYWPRPQVRELFYKKAVSMDVFLSKHLSWAFVKLDMIKNFEFRREGNKLKSYISFEGFKEKFLVKDFRWLHYWSSIADTEKEDKMRYWISFCNARKRSLYAVCCWYTFKNGSQRFWIAGLHPFSS